MNKLLAIIILFGGFALLWGFVLQLDKATAFMGNALSKVTGKAQQALAGYRNNTLKRNFGLWKEGQLNNSFGKATRGFGERLGAAEHISQTSGTGFFGAMMGSEEGDKALQHIRRRRSLKLLENEMGADSGNDELMEVLADMNPKNVHEAGDMLYNLRKKRFDQKKAHYEANGAAFNETWDDEKEKEAARSQAVSAQETFGAPIGSAGMRIAATRALLSSATAFNDIATRYQTFSRNEAGEIVGNADGMATEEGKQAMFRRMERVSGKMRADGLMTEIDTTQAKKKNAQRSEISGNSFAQELTQTAKSAGRIAELRKLGVSDAEIDQLEDITLTTIARLQDQGVSNTQIASIDVPALQRAGLSDAQIKRLQLDRNAVAGAVGVVAKLRANGLNSDRIAKLDVISDDEVDNWVDKSIEYTSAGQRGQRGESVHVQGTHLMKKLQQAYETSRDRVAQAKTAAAPLIKRADDAGKALQQATDYQTVIMSRPDVPEADKLAAIESTRKARQDYEAAQTGMKAAQDQIDAAEYELIRVMAIGSAEQQALIYRNPDAAKKLDAVFSSQQMPGKPGVTVGAEQEHLRQTNDTFARLERVYRQNPNAAYASAAASGGTPPGGGPPSPGGPVGP